MPDLRPDSEETRCLLKQAARGDLAAVEGLLVGHRDALRSFVDLHLDRSVRGRIDLSDVVQESLMDVTNRLPEFLAGRSIPFHVWARQFAYQRLLNARRDHHAGRRDVALEANGPDQSSIALVQSIVAPNPSPSEEAAARELAKRAAVEALADADREILLLRDNDNLPFDQIAVLFGIEPTAARKRFGRALRRLQKARAASGIAREAR